MSNALPKYKVSAKRQQSDPADAWKGEESQEMFCVQEFVDTKESAGEKFVIYRVLCECQYLADADKIAKAFMERDALAERVKKLDAAIAGTLNGLAEKVEAVVDRLKAAPPLPPKLPPAVIENLNGYQTDDGEYIPGSDPGDDPDYAGA